MSSKIQVRRDTHANWVSADPILSAGEIGFETDTGKFKIGNGTDVYTDLYFAALSPELGGQIHGNILMNNNVIKDLGSPIDPSDATTKTYVETSISNHNEETTSIHGIFDTAELATKNYADEEVSNHNDNTTNIHGITDTSALATKTYADSAASNAVSTHNSDSTSVHGIADTSELATTTYADAAAGTAQDNAEGFATTAVSNHNSVTTSVHGIADTSELATTTYADAAAGTAQDNAEGFATTAVSNHNSATTSVHGIADTSALATKTYADTSVSTHNSATTSVHGISDTSALATKTYADSAASGAVSTHNSASTSVHGIADTSALATKTYANDAVSTHNSASTSVHGIADTSALATKTYAETYTNTQITNLINGAPSTLDTLKELSDALGADKDFATTVTNSIATKLPKAGGTMSGNIAMGSNSITGLAAPSSDNDAATKKYVDDQTTTDIAEGTNLYFTNERAQDAVGDNLGTGLSYNDSTGAISNSGVTAFNTRTGSISLSDTDVTDALGYTPVDVADFGSYQSSTSTDISNAITTAENYTDTVVGLLTTTDIPEGTGLYFTNERAQDAIGDNLGTGLSYNDSTGAISVNTSTIQARVTDVSDTEIGYLDGVTSAIQTQIDSKLASSTASSTYAPIASPTFTGTVSGVTKTHVGLGNVDNTSDANKPISTATQSALDLKAPLASPTFTGTPSAPTAVSATNNTQVATTEFVKTAVDNLINGAGAAYDTLKELSDLIIADESTASSLATLVGQKAPIASPTFTGTVTLPLSTAGYVATTSGGVISSVATIPNAGLTNSKVTVGTTDINLGSSATTLAGLTSVTSTGFTGALTGNADTATKLATARNINGVSFDGSAAITVTAAAGTLSGDTLASGVTTSSLTTVGTITSGTWSGTTIAVNKGGTGATDASTARTNLGATTLGSNIFTQTNPSAITFPKYNADNTVSAESASTHRTSIGIGNVENTALSTWAGSTNITTLGTVTSGTIGGGVTLDYRYVTPIGYIQVAQGGTGITSISANQAVYGNGTNTMTAGTLPIAAGGTGATTAMTAATALLPSQTSNSGKYLTNDGAGTLSWASVSGYSAPTIGSTLISSGTTVTTIAGLTLTTPVIDSISAASAAGTATSLFPNITTGTMAIGAGLTTGTINIATAGTGVNAINLGNSNSTITINGNLTVSGTTTTVNSSTLAVADSNIEIAKVASPTDVTANGAGITIKGATDKTINWYSSTASFLHSENVDVATGKTYKINGTDVLTSTQVLGKAVPSGTILGTTDTQTLTNKSLSDSTTYFVDVSDATKKLNIDVTGTTGITGTLTSAFTTAKTLTLPDATDTLVGKATTDTLTNKTIGTSAAATTVSLNTATTVDTTALSGFTTIRYVLSIKQGSKVRSSQIMVQTDGTSVDSNEFAIIETGGKMTGIAVAASVSSTNMILTVTITDASGTNATVKLQKVML